MRKLLEQLSGWYNNHFVKCAECNQGAFYDDGSSALSVLVDKEARTETILCITHLYANPDFAKMIT